jgi:hypothetical protein
MTIPYQIHNKTRKLSYNNPDSNLVDYKHYFSIFRGKPFWICDKEIHKEEFIKTNGNCCFNHIIGLPVKNGKEYPIFDESLDWETNDVSPELMKIIPINFMTSHKQMLSNLHLISKGYLAIPKKYDKLITVYELHTQQNTV